MSNNLICKQCGKDKFFIRPFTNRGRYKTLKAPVYKYYYVCCDCEAPHEVGELEENETN